MTVRSVRSNNPGNIESNSTAWVGKTGDDGRFVTFATPAHGVRAMGKTLETYQNKHGLTTVNDMINRWAPPNENNTTNYANFVAQRMGVDPNQSIDLSENPELAEKMVTAMIRMEGGPEAEEYFADSVADGLGMAYGTINEAVVDAEDNEIKDALTEDGTAPVVDPNDKLNPEDERETKTQILNKSTSLAQVIKSMENRNMFWDNELDVYQSYTYNLEFFVVNQQEAQSYLKYENQPEMLQDVVNDAWPHPGVQKITIAQTGVSTELNIHDLTIEGLGYGAQSVSRMAGTAVRLSFSITQVGGTSLPDMLNNAVLLCGYPNIQNAMFFMKINFVGYDDNNQVKKLPATKVLPFKIRTFRDLDSTTDARGTSLNIEGVIANDEVVNVATIAQVQTNFNFDVKNTLEETLEDFFVKLNKNVEKNAIVGDSEFRNEYKFVMDDDFKQKFGQAEMKDPNNPNMSSASNETEKKDAIKVGQHQGVVQPGTAIYDCINSIIINAKQVKEELTASKDEMTDIFYIKPHGEPKPKGFNILTGKSSYIITYHISLHRSMLPQNQINNAQLVSETAKVLKEIFLTGRCAKRYYYQYTGRNDQILDFTISLRNQLMKAYSHPSDAYMANSFLKSISDYRKFIDEKAQQKLTELEAEAEVLNAEYKKKEEVSEKLIDDFENMQKDIISKFKQRVKDIGIGDVYGEDRAYIQRLMRTGDVNRLRDALQQGESPAYEIFNDFFKGETRENFNKLNNAVRDAQIATNDALTELEANQREDDDVTREALGHMLSKKVLESTSAIEQSWDSLGLTAEGRQEDILLVEELDKEIVKKLSIDQFSALMKTLVENPVNFDRVVKPILKDPTKLDVIKNPNAEEIQLAKEKYYEGRYANLSMINATMTIKGDPYWLETFVPVEVEKGNFGKENSNDNLKMHSTTLNGHNYIVIIVDKAEDVFLENPDEVGTGSGNSDGIKKTRLETMVYQVNEIVHSFSGGQFTQTLSLVKHPAASTFKEVKPEFGGNEFPDLWEDQWLKKYTNIKPELGTNDGTGTGSDGTGKDAEGQAAEAGNIGVPEGAGNALVDTDGDGEGDTLVVENTDAAYLAASAAYKNATGLFIDNDGVDGIPEEADAKQLALVTSQLQDLCNLGNQAACTDLAMGRQQIATHFGEADDARNIINESIDDGTTVSPATIAMLDNTYEALGQEKISDGVVGVDQDEIDAWTDQINESMDRSYLGNNDAVINPNQIMSDLEPGGLFGKAGSDAMLNGDVELYDGAMYARQKSEITGGQTRQYSVEAPKKTLTAQEFNQVTSLQEENEDIIKGRSLWELTDEEYAEVKANEKAINTITENATSGVRGEVRDEVIDKERRGEISKLKQEEQELEDDLDGWYFTNKGRQEDEQKLNDVRQQLLSEQVEASPVVMTEVKEIANAPDGDNFRTVNLPKTTEDEPVVVPKPAELPDVYIDNNDGTITIPPPAPETYNVTPAGDTAIDNLNVPDDVKDEYKEVLESNNGIKVKQYIDSLPADQQTEILQLQETQNLVELPGSKPADLGYEADSGVNINNVTENDRKQLAAARGIYDNIAKQAETLPTKDITYTMDIGNGVETWTETVPDLSKLEPVNYIDANGNVQTYTVDPNKVNLDNGWTGGAISSIKSDIATEFPSITSGSIRQPKQLEAGDPARVNIGTDTFAIEVIELDDTGGAQ